MAEQLDPLLQGTPRKTEMGHEEVDWWENEEPDENINFDFVITVCDNAKERCPVFPTKAHKTHQNFSDPAKAEGTAEEILAEFKERLKK